MIHCTDFIPQIDNLLIVPDVSQGVWTSCGDPEPFHWSIFHCNFSFALTICKRIEMLKPRSSLSHLRNTQIAKFMGPTWGPPRSCRPRWAPCWPHEPCYEGGYQKRISHCDMYIFNIFNCQAQWLCSNTFFILILRQVLRMGSVLKTCCAQRYRGE